MKSYDELKERFKDARPLTDKDWQGFLDHVEDRPDGTATIVLQARGGWEFVLAIRRFERSSGRLAWVLIILTIVLVLLTGMIAWLTWVLTHKPGG